MACVTFPGGNETKNRLMLHPEPAKQCQNTLPVLRQAFVLPKFLKDAVHVAGSGLSELGYHSRFGHEGGIPKTHKNSPYASNDSRTLHRSRCNPAPHFRGLSSLPPRFGSVDCFNKKALPRALSRSFGRLTELTRWKR